MDITFQNQQYNQPKLGSLSGGDHLDYVPSSLEQKKAVLMYFIFGILASLLKKELSVFEIYHLKQSIGRWLFAIVSLVFSIVFIFLPFVKRLPFFIFLILIVFLFVFINQAWTGKYKITGSGPLSLFFGLGTWFLNIFDVQIITSGTMITTNNIQNNQYPPQSNNQF